MQELSTIVFRISRYDRFLFNLLKAIEPDYFPVDEEPIDSELANVQWRTTIQRGDDVYVPKHVMEFAISILEEVLERSGDHPAVQALLSIFKEAPEMPIVDLIVYHTLDGDYDGPIIHLTYTEARKRQIRAAPAKIA